MFSAWTPNGARALCPYLLIVLAWLCVFSFFFYGKDTNKKGREGGGWWGESARPCELRGAPARPGAEGLMNELRKAVSFISRSSLKVLSKRRSWRVRELMNNDPGRVKKTALQGTSRIEVLGIYWTRVFHLSCRKFIILLVELEFWSIEREFGKPDPIRVPIIIEHMKDIVCKVYLSDYSSLFSPSD